MEKNKVTCLTFHNPFNMGGVNFGNKIDTNVRKDIEMIDDIARNRVWIKFKGITTFVPDSNIVAGSVQNVPEDIQAMFGVDEEDTLAGPPAVARSRRTKLEMEAARVHEEAAAFDPNDTSPEAHRARVRAASANANRPDQTGRAQNDHLIQEARNAAMGAKFNAQVSNPTQPTKGASVVPKTKALSHAQLKAQMAAEDKA